MHDNDELTNDERALLAGLSREMQPSELLEPRVVRALKEQGHFNSARRASSPGIGLAWRTAAAAALFAGGVATGRYVLAADTTGAAVVESSSSIRTGDSSTPRTVTRSVKPKETVVAEREMWL